MSYSCISVSSRSSFGIRLCIFNWIILKLCEKRDEFNELEAVETEFCSGPGLGCTSFDKIMCIATYHAVKRKKQMSTTLVNFVLFFAFFPCTTFLKTPGYLTFKGRVR